mgnify:CR=1 FL=1|jgi:hypothetical protein|tara:strand:- start:1523 stop:1837 length:315 start_codon:yes stop_codon:yes gene_type:complete
MGNSKVVTKAVENFRDGADNQTEKIIMSAEPKHIIVAAMAIETSGIMGDINWHDDELDTGEIENSIKRMYVENIAKLNGLNASGVTMVNDLVDDYLRRIDVIVK